MLAALPKQEYKTDYFVEKVHGSYFWMISFERPFLNQAQKIQLESMNITLYSLFTTNRFNTITRYVGLNIETLITYIWYATSQ